MAYTPGNPFGDEEENLGAPGAPTVSAPSVGSTPSVGGTVAGSSPVAQQNTGGAGTGFTNIDRVLAANKGAAGAVKQRADQSLAQDQSAFSAALGDATGKVNAQKPTADPNKLVGDVLGSSGDLQAKAVEAARGVIGATYSGPTAVSYDIGNTGDIKRAQTLGNSQTAGRQIATENNTLAGYAGTGLEAIDRAIYGSAGEAPTLQAANAETAGQIGAQTKANEGLGKTAADTATAIAKTGADTKAAFQGKAAWLQTDAQKAADAANAANAAAQAARPADASVTGYGDFKSADDLRQQLGESAFLKEGEGQSMNPGHRAAMDALTNEQRNSYDAIMKQYPNMKWAQAIELAKSAGGLNALRNTQQYQASSHEWIPGSSPAQASSFLDAGGLNAIGKVLGDEALMGTTKGPEFQGGHWQENKIMEAPPGGLAGPLPAGYARDGNGNLVVAPGFSLGAGGVPYNSGGHAGKKTRQRRA